MLKSKKTALWRGLEGVCSVMLTFSVMAGMVVDNFRTDIDKFVGTNSQVTVARL